MLAVAVPGYVNHEHPIVLDDNTTHEQVMESIHEAVLNNPLPANLGLNEAGVGLGTYRLGIAINYLSQAHNLQNFCKGQIISRLEALEHEAEAAEKSSHMRWEILLVALPGVLAFLMEIQSWGIA